ncbi:glyoxylase I family protein [bacterium A37T11]|nr:glyoxylase I family protein [bacterium A37T11]
MNVDSIRIQKLGLTGIDHPALAADDPENLADWYCDVLGYRKYFSNDKPVFILRAPDGSLLEVMPKDETVRLERTTWTPGWSHLALRVENLDEAIAYLDQQKVVWGGEVIEAIGGGLLRTFQDPEGNMLQIVERTGYSDKTK